MTKSFLSRYDLNYFLDSFKEGPERYLEFYDLLTTPRFKTGEIGVSGRQLDYWKKKGLLDNVAKSTGWRTFSFVDYVWFQVIKKLRNLDVGMELIKKIRKEIYSADEDLLEKMILRFKDPKLRDMVDGEVKQKLFNSEMTARVDSLSKEEIKEISHRYNSLTFLSVGLVTIRMPIWLMIDKKGFYGFFALGRIQRTTILNDVLKDLKNDLIIINLYEILENFLQNGDVDVSNFYDLELLSDKEMKVVKAIREKKFVKIIIRMKNGEIDIIETKNERKIKEVEKKINHLFKNGDYGEIRIVLEKGRPIIFEETERVRV